MDDSFSKVASEGDDDDPRFGHRRAGTRDSLFLQAIVRREGSPTAVTMRVRNLSPGGMMAETGEPFVEGERVEIELRGIGALEGGVIWRTERRIGIAFSAPIDPRRARKSVAQRPAAPVATPVAAVRAIRRPKLFGE